MLNWTRLLRHSYIISITSNKYSVMENCIRLCIHKYRMSHTINMIWPIWVYFSDFTWNDINTWSRVSYVQCRGVYSVQKIDKPSWSPNRIVSDLFVLTLPVSEYFRVLKMHEIASKKVGENCVSNEENVWKRLSEVISSEVVSRHMVAVFYFRFRIRKL